MSKHCEEHSGFIVWQRGIAIVLTYAAALLTYSVIWQAPGIRQEIANHINDNKLRAFEVNERLKELEKKSSIKYQQMADIP